MGGGDKMEKTKKDNHSKSANLLLLLTISAAVVCLAFVAVAMMDAGSRVQYSSISEYLKKSHQELTTLNKETKKRRAVRFAQAKVLRGEGRTVFHRHRGVDYRVEPVSHVSSRVNQKKSESPSDYDRNIRGTVRHYTALLNSTKSKKSASPKKSKLSERDIIDNRYTFVFEMADLKAEIYKKVVKHYQSTKGRVLITLEKVDSKKETVTLRVGVADAAGNVRPVKRKAFFTVKGKKSPFIRGKRGKVVKVQPKSTVGHSFYGQQETFKKMSGSTQQSLLMLGASVNEKNQQNLKMDQAGSFDVKDLAPDAPKDKKVHLARPALDMLPIVETQEDDPIQKLINDELIEFKFPKDALEGASLS